MFIKLRNTILYIYVYYLYTKYVHLKACNRPVSTLSNNSRYAYLTVICIIVMKY